MALYVGKGSESEQGYLLSSLSAGFHSLPLLPTSKLGPSGADTWVGGLVYVLGPLGLSSKLSCEAGSFSCNSIPTGFFSQRFCCFISPRWNPGLCGLSRSPGVPPSLSAMQMWDHLLPQQTPSLVLATLPGVFSALAARLRPSYQSG